MTKLSELESAKDFKVLAHHTHEVHYDGPDGPFDRKIVGKVFANDLVWIRKFRWIDKGLGISESYWIKESTE